MTQRKNRTDCVYEYIQEQWQEASVPTLSEISIACQMSVSTVREHLSRLEAQGKITREPYKSRSIRLTESSVKSNETAEMVYDYLVENELDGEIPSQEEMATACLLSRDKVRRALIWLEAQGRIERGKGQRSIRLLDGE